MKLLRPLYEAWLFKATEGGLPAWQGKLLARALRDDEALRCLAAELAEFSHGEAPAGENAPDLAYRLGARIAEDSVQAPERPLFPSAWVPAGAIAVLLITGWVALAVKPAADPRAGEASAQPSKAAEELALAAPLPLPAIPPATLSSTAAALSPSASVKSAAAPRHPDAARPEAGAAPAQ